MYFVEIVLNKSYVVTDVNFVFHESVVRTLSINERAINLSIRLKIDAKEHYDCRHRYHVPTPAVSIHQNVRNVFAGMESWPVEGQRPNWPAEEVGIRTARVASQSRSPAGQAASPKKRPRTPLAKKRSIRPRGSLFALRLWFCLSGADWPSIRRGLGLPAAAF